jgi:hypothetical protein
MWAGNEIMNKTTSVISVLQLRQLLIDIKENGQGICVRFRSLGEMWQTNMMRVVAVTDNRVLINDEVSNKLISLDLNHVMQFEVDHKFKGLEPYFHYDIIPDSF